MSSDRSVIQLYLTNEKNLTKINDIKNETFIDFKNWRINKSWRILVNSKSTSPPRLSTVKQDLVRLNDWYKNFLIPKGYAKKIPSINTIIINKDNLYPNPPISRKDDWPHIYDYFVQWSNKINNKNSNRSTEYFRMMMRNFVFVSYNTGIRPKELLGSIEKVPVQCPDSGWRLNEIVKGGLRWCDVDIDRLEHEKVNGKRLDSLKADLYIRDSKKGFQRKIPTNLGNYIIEFRQYSDKFRRKNGLNNINDKDFIFFNPFTSLPYPYSQISRAWKEMRINLAVFLKGFKSYQPYTLYSLRTSYITNQINFGKDFFLIRKLTGHSIEALTRYYDRYY